jgi:hypothetical protein
VVTSRHECQVSLEENAKYCLCTNTLALQALLTSSSFFSATVSPVFGCLSEVHLRPNAIRKPRTGAAAGRY